MSDGSGSCLSQKTCGELAARGMTGEIARKGDKAPIQAGQRRHVERTNAFRPAAALLRAQGRRHRRLLRPRRHHHYRPQPPPGMDLSPIGQPPGEAAMITYLSARPPRARAKSWDDRCIRRLPDVIKGVSAMQPIPASRDVLNLCSSDMRWGGWGSNPRPADYEKYGLTLRMR
jgi:hypothetical protein